MDNRNLSTDQNAMGNNTKRNIGLVLAYLFFSLGGFLAPHLHCDSFFNLPTAGSRASGWTVFFLNSFQEVMHTHHNLIINAKKIKNE
jgi:hypothetical protein